MRDFIESFLNSKKEDFLQAKINSKLRGKKNEFEEEARLRVRVENETEADEKYSLDTWLENIVCRVKPNVTTHPAKFTNAKIDTDTAQIFLGNFQKDGYLKTGNVNLKNKVDVSGNSATNTMVFELYELLDSAINHNEKLIHKFENNDESLQKLIQQLKGDFDFVKEKCLKVYYGETSLSQTHGSTRQVYFPIDQDQYHLLSIKTASMLMYELKNRIDAMDIWIDKQHARTFKKDNRFLDGGFSEILGLTEIGFSPESFTKMGNYSFLNVKNKGISYLLSSCPPMFEKRHVKLPSKDFFEQCLYYKKFSDDFNELSKLIGSNSDEINQIRNNQYTRKKMKRVIQTLIENILFIAFCIRKHKAGWSETEHYIQLPLAQKIWLDNINFEKRDLDEHWRDEISRRIGKWILDAFEELIQRKIFGNIEILAVKELVLEALDEDKEFF